MSRRNSLSPEAWPRAAGGCVCTLSVAESAWPQGPRGQGLPRRHVGAPGQVRCSRRGAPGAQQRGQAGRQGSGTRWPRRENRRLWLGCLGPGPGGPGAGGIGHCPLPLVASQPAPQRAACAPAAPAFSQCPRLFCLGASTVLSSRVDALATGLPWPLAPRCQPHIASPEGPFPTTSSPWGKWPGLERTLCSCVVCSVLCRMQAPGEWLAGVGGPWVGIGCEPPPAWGPCGVEWAEHEVRSSNKAPASPCCVTTGWPLRCSEPGSLSPVAWR